MRNMLLSLVLCALPGAALANGSADDPAATLAWDENRVVQVQVSEAGTPAVYWYEIERAGYMMAEPFFPLPAAGNVTFSFLDADGNSVNAHDSLAEAAGVYGVEITAAPEFTGEVRVELELYAPLDLFEPNDSVEAAREITLPFEAIVQTNGDADRDWFTFKSPGSGVLGVHFDAPFSGPGPQFVLQDNDGEVIYQLPVDDFSHAAMRYMPVRSGRYHLQVWDMNTRSYASRFPTLRVAFYPDKSGTIGSPGIGAMGFDIETQGYAQLELISRATGVPLIQADTPEQISEALASAISEGGMAWYWWVLIVLLMGAAGYGGWVLYQRRRAKPAADSLTPEPS